MERQTLTVPQMAEAIGISKNRAYELCAEGLIPHLRLGGRIVIPVAALEHWLANVTPSGQRQASRLNGSKRTP